MVVRWVSYVDVRWPVATDNLLEVSEETLRAVGRTGMKGDLVGRSVGAGVVGAVGPVRRPELIPERKQSAVRVTEKGDVIALDAQPRQGVNGFLLPQTGKLDVVFLADAK